METFNLKDLSELYKPSKASHKGQNGKLLVIGGCHLFHAASLWALKVASRMVDMVFYSSVEENNEIVRRAKEEFRDGIIVPRKKVEDYVREADCILIGPGLPREEGREESDDCTKDLTTNLLTKYKNKRWVIDGGSLQTIDPKVIPSSSILTPHKKEFEKLFSVKPNEESVSRMAKKYDCIILLKGVYDIVCSKEKCLKVTGGNEGMTKGGTGDVLAGLTAAFHCKNGPFLSALAASYINKKAGDELYKKMGPYFNASDLVNQIPLVLKETLDY